jgi:hypothetical protein
MGACGRRGKLAYCCRTGGGFPRDRGPDAEAPLGATEVIAFQPDATGSGLYFIDLPKAEIYCLNLKSQGITFAKTRIDNFNDWGSALVYAD